MSPPSNQIITMKNTHFCSPVHRRLRVGFCLLLPFPISGSVLARSTGLEPKFLSLMGDSDEKDWDMFQ